MQRCSALFLTLLQCCAAFPRHTACYESTKTTRKCGHPNRSKLKLKFAGCMQCFRVKDSCLVVLHVQCSLFSSTLQCCAALPRHTACHSSIHIMRKDCIRSTHFLGNFSHWADGIFSPPQCSLPLLTSNRCSIPMSQHMHPIHPQTPRASKWSSEPFEIEFEFAGCVRCFRVRLGLDINVWMRCRGAVLSSPAHFSVVQHSHATLHATNTPKLRASAVVIRANRI